jgi:hypothetical protein
MYVLHFGFLFNDECLENYKFSWCRNLFYFLQSWEGFQSPIPFMSKTPPSPLSQTKTWCGRLGYTMEGKIKWPFNWEWWSLGRTEPTPSQCYLHDEIPIHRNVLLHMRMGIAREHV